MKIYLAYGIYTESYPSFLRNEYERESKNLYVGTNKNDAIQKAKKFLFGDYEKPIAYIQEWKNGECIEEYEVTQ